MLSNSADFSSFTDEQLESSLSQIEIELKEASNQKKRLVETLLTRKHDEIEAALAAKDEPFGTIHIGNFEITVGKKITYDQEKLAALAKEIEAAGEKISDYIEISYDIKESRYKAWPEPIKAQFIPARTIARGNPSVKIKQEKE